MARDLTDQVIVITGASSGIGYATAIEAAKAGMHVAVAARRADRLTQLAGEVRALGRKALAIETDVARDDDVQRLVDQTMQELGGIDVMFANAGYGFMKPVEDMTDAEHRHIFEVNYFGTVRCVKAALPIMQRAGRGHMVICSSIVGRVGLPFYAHYSATKAAQSVFATALRVELEPHHIDVTAVYPIGTKTEFFKVSADIGGRDLISQNTPDMFMQSPDHVARRVVKALRKPCKEVWPARWAHLGSSLACLWPGMTHRSLCKHAGKDRVELAKVGADPRTGSMS